ncbi:MAG: hypothetical protein IKO72_10490 [Kiritimatiellae bacterium]|nr:hypothetical protein [Kiritimatiellia bacterium]
MNFLLKIVEGPNKGAEIALVAGVAVTLGKSDECDIVLADPTLPSEAIRIEASDDGVTVDGGVLEPFVVRTAGATAFAVGPADAPWNELKWPEKTVEAKPEGEEGRAAADERRETGGESHASSPAPEGGEAAPEGRKKRGGCCGCLVALVLLILALAALAWSFREKIRDFCESKGYDIHAISNMVGVVTSPGRTEQPTAAGSPTLAAIAARYGLQLEETAGTARLAGNLKTRGERLRATAEAYEARPGVELDISDDESFRTAAEDALFTLTEGALKVVYATNRVLAISGISRSPGELGHTIRALDADLPKLRKVDTEDVKFGALPRRVTRYRVREDLPVDLPVDMPAVKRPASRKATSPTLPVCGILTKPYPCLVMRDGTRVLEGASVGGNIILKIDADAVTVTNSTGRFTWRP